MSRWVGLLLSAVYLVATAPGANAQGFHPYDWWRGRSGLFSPDYVTPSFDEPGYLFSDTFGARRARGAQLVFAAASVDQYCQQDGSPTIHVLSAPATGRIETDIGGFVATASNAGSQFCVGRPVRGTRVFYRGRAGRGERIVLRVVYPTKRLTYDHVVSLR